MANNQYNSFHEFFRQQVKNYREASVPAKVLRMAVITTAGEVKKRIQNQGLKSDGSPMSPYSTKPFARPSGKRGKGKVKKYPGGYAEFRSSLGFQTNHRDLTLSGDMFDTWFPVPIDRNSYGVAFRSPKMAQRANFQEVGGKGGRGAQGPIFQETIQEQKRTLQAINTEAIRYLSR